MKTKLLGLFLIFILYGHHSSGERSDASVYQSALEGAQYGDMLIKSCTGNITYEISWDDSTKTQTKNTMVKDFSPGGEKPVNSYLREIYFALCNPYIRYEESIIEKSSKGNPYHKKTIVTYNGETSYRIVKRGFDANDISIRGSIESGNSIKLNSLPTYWGLNILGVSVASFLSGSLDGNDFNIESAKYVGEGIQDGLHCLIFTASNVEKSATRTVWLSPDRMYRPKHLETRHKDGSTVCHIMFEQVNNDIWFPKKILIETYKKNKLSGKYEPSSYGSITVLDFEVNTQLSDELFTLQFPSGTVLQDKRTHEIVKIK